MITVKEARALTEIDMETNGIMDKISSAIEDAAKKGKYYADVSHLTNEQATYLEHQGYITHEDKYQTRIYWS